MKSFKELRKYWRPIRKKTRKSNSLIYKRLKKFSLENKLEQTKAEKEFEKILSNLNYNFSYINQAILFRQNKKYIIDFAILHPFYIVFEIDGKYHTKEEQKIKDIERSSFISNLGYKVIRFTNDEIFKDSKKVISVILNELNKQKQLNNFCKERNIFKGSITRVSSIRCKDKASALASQA